MNEREKQPYYRNFIYDVLDLMFLIARNDPEVEKYTKFLTRKGERFKIRPISPEDDDAVLELYYSLSQETVYFRFFQTKKNVPKSRVRQFTRIDYRKNFALVVENPQKKLIGIGRFIVDKDDPDSAEMSIVIADAYQRRGIGTILIKYLVQIAKERGIKKIYATVLSDNYKILGTIDKLGFKFQRRLEDGDLRVECDLSTLKEEEPLPFDHDTENSPN
ncbi:MAG: GNAT family N-acetyltransferase [Candidatus Helarchaeales archaeon]